MTRLAAFLGNVLAVASGVVFAVGVGRLAYYYLLVGP